MQPRQILRRAISLGLMAAFTVLAACGDAAVTLTHVHGLAFSPDGQRHVCRGSGGHKIKCFYNRRRGGKKRPPSPTRSPP